jgi:hypothetical protein
LNIHLLTPDQYPLLLAFIDQSNDSDAQLFLASALSNHAEGLQVYVRQEGERLRGAVALLPSLPPFRSSSLPVNRAPRCWHTLPQGMSARRWQWVPRRS